MELEKGVQRWVVNIARWDPSPDYFAFLVSVLPCHHHHSITRYLKMEDRKRALVSRLLQYALVHQVCGLPYSRITIERTDEGKPYLLEYDDAMLGLPNLNFSVSHHGDYVAIASEPVCIVGLDIVTHIVPGEEKAEEFIKNFESYFSHFEWSQITSVASCNEMLREFFRYWCLKESFVKAIGTGVGYRLDNVEFHHEVWENISVNVDGQELKDWKFRLIELDNVHTMAVARGHPRMASANYKRTLKKIEFVEEVYRHALHLPDPNFNLRTVEDLLLCLEITQVSGSMENHNTF
ncbi:hypothetical protein Leryth_005472 [Lithospermum erythrorhizon]|nr:hypothetical protein Leryth_005472 [Lithospermum erythrorhizon]